MIDIRSRLAKTTASLLIALQLAMPTASHADLLGEVIGKAVAGAVGLGDSGKGNPFSPTADQQKGMEEAKVIIGNGQLKPVSPDGILLGTRVETLNLYDNDQLQRVFARYQAEKEKIAGKKTITYRELADFTASLQPYLAYIEAQHRMRFASGITIPPGSTASVQVNAFCMDKTLPAPRRDERLQILSAGTLVPEEVRPLYENLLKYKAGDSSVRFFTQNLIWGLREASEGRSFILQMNGYQREFLDAAMPGGADLYQSYLDAQAEKRKETERKQEAYKAIAGIVGGLTGIALPPPPGQHGYSPAETESALAQLIKAPVKGEMLPDFDYSMLAPGVAIKTSDASGLASLVRMTISNSTDQPFVFRPTDYVAQASRPTQRLAMTGFVPSSTETSQEAMKLAKNIAMDAQRLLSGKNIEGGWRQNRLDFGKLVQNPELRMLLMTAPFIGSGIAAYEAYFGTGFFDGEQLSKAERMLALASIVPEAGLLAGVIKSGKYINTITRVEKPIVSDRKLSNLINDLYKGANTSNPIGTGSTADAIRYEAKTGLPVGGKYHTQKGREYKTALEKWLMKNPEAAQEDRHAAQAVLDDLSDAIGE